MSFLVQRYTLTLVSEPHCPFFAPFLLDADSLCRHVSFTLVFALEFTFRAPFLILFLLIHRQNIPFPAWFSHRSL